MRNRSRYILQRNDYDMLCSIIDYGTAISEDFCIIDALGAKGGYCDERGCKECIQKWLNKEAVS